MRHAAPRPTAHAPLSRAAQLTLGALAYATAGLTIALIAFGSALTIWGLWQRMGGN